MSIEVITIMLFKFFTSPVLSFDEIKEIIEFVDVDKIDETRNILIDLYQNSWDNEIKIFGLSAHLVANVSRDYAEIVYDKFMRQRSEVDEIEDAFYLMPRTNKEWLIIENGGYSWKYDRKTHRDGDRQYDAKNISKKRIQRRKEMNKFDQEYYSYTAAHADIYMKA